MCFLLCPLLYFTVVVVFIIKSKIKNIIIIKKEKKTDIIIEMDFTVIASIIVSIILVLILVPFALMIYLDNRRQAIENGNIEEDEKGNIQDYRGIQQTPRNIEETKMDIIRTIPQTISTKKGTSPTKKKKKSQQIQTDVVSPPQSPKIRQVSPSPSQASSDEPIPSVDRTQPKRYVPILRRSLKQSPGLSKPALPVIQEEQETPLRKYQETPQEDQEIENEFAKMIQIANAFEKDKKVLELRQVWQNYYNIIKNEWVNFDQLLQQYKTAGEQFLDVDEQLNRQIAKKVIVDFVDKVTEENLVKSQQHVRSKVEKYERNVDDEKEVQNSVRYKRVNLQNRQNQQNLMHGTQEDAVKANLMKFEELQKKNFAARGETVWLLSKLQQILTTNTQIVTEDKKALLQITQFYINKIQKYNEKLYKIVDKFVTASNTIITDMKMPLDKMKKFVEKQTKKQIKETEKVKAKLIEPETKQYTPEQQKLIDDYMNVRNQLIALRRQSQQNEIDIIIADTKINYYNRTVHYVDQFMQLTVSAVTEVEQEASLFQGINETLLRVLDNLIKQ